ncbi:S9 family peptidase [Massilia sp. BSC265]|uniref:alpha/beta hydrolase family protein n=1 Tax=Massilia sp. BSC265 TaxID=1549812 RepID=UPI0004E8ADB3|nr:S9 family peptidase [Massilia sp. BSC265]KFI06607.1 hypothetical protein JN27_12995 [Massilia sp. BSC265]
MRLRATLLCATLLALHLPSFAAAPIVPISAFVDENKYTIPRLSPDGKQLAITVRVPSGERTVPVIMVYSLPDLKVTGGIRLPVHEVPLDYDWVSNARLVIARGFEQGSRTTLLNHGELLASDIDGKNQVYLHGYRMPRTMVRGGRHPDDHATGVVEGVAREYNNHVFVSSQLWEADRTLLYDINTQNNARKLIAELPMKELNFLVQNDGRPRFAFGVDADFHAVVFRNNEAKGAWDKITGMGSRYTPLAFSPDDSRFAALYSKTGEPESLVVEDARSGERKTLYADPVAMPLRLYGGRGGLPFGAASSVGIPRASYFDDASEDARLHKLLSDQFPGNFVNFESASRDGQTMLFSVRSDRDPGSYYLFDRKSGKADLLFTSMEAIEPDQMAERRPVGYRARDGLEIHGYLTMPRRAAGAKLPLILIPHGGPHGVYDNWFFDTDAQFLASRGYAVLQLNFRGSGGRGPSFRDAGYRQWSGKIQDDLVDGVKWTIAQGDIDPRRICVYGASFGAYSAMMLAAREPGMFRCAVGYAGVYDLNLLTKTDEAVLDRRIGVAVDRFVGKEEAELTRSSPVTQAERIKAPVLLVHGGQDKRTPIAHAEAMRKSLTAAGRAPEWFVAPSEGHGFYDTKNQAEFYRRLESFLGRHLGQP